MSNPAQAADASAVSISVNRSARPLVERLLARREALRIEMRPGPHEAMIIDAGIAAPGSIAAGVAIAEICMGGLGRVALRPSNGSSTWPTWIEVTSSQPVLACLASQYAGWSLAATKEQTGGRKFFAL